MSDDDFSPYLHHLVHLDLPLEAKIEMLRVLQVMMRSFVDRAFGDDPVQLARRDGDEIRIEREADSSAVVPLEDHNSTEDKAQTDAFTQRADRATRKENV